MAEGTRIENRIVTESIENGKITFNMTQRVVITDLLNYWVDAECKLTLPLNVFNVSVNEEFDGDRKTAIEAMCNRSPNWITIWSKPNRIIGESAV